MRHCLLVTLEYPPFHGGIAHYYGHLVKNWPDLGTMAVLNNNNYQLQAKSGFWPWRRAFSTIGQAIRRSGINFVLVGQILPLGTVVWLLSYVLPIKYGVFVHGMDWGMAVSRPRKRWLAQRVMHRAATVIAGNSYVAGLVQQAVPGVASRLIIINPGLDKAEPPIIAKDYLVALRQRYDLNNCQILLTVGRLVERKGVDRVLAAMPELVVKYPNLRYIIIGQGPYLEYCRQLVKQLAIDSAVIFITTADDQERAAWYQLADVFIMPSRQIGGDFEGFGIVYLEANCASKPVIAGRSGGVGDAVVDGLNGLLVNPESIAEIVTAVNRLLSDQALRHRLGQAGQQRLVDFLWPALATKLSRFINKICS